MFTNVHFAAVSPETRLLSAFKKDNQTRKVYLAGRGESAIKDGFIYTSVS